MDDDTDQQTPLLPLLPILTPAQQRARRYALKQAREKAEVARTLITPLVAPEQIPHLPERTPTYRNQIPATCRFDERTLTRVPVVMTERAQKLLWQAHHQARLFPQALEEACGQHAHPHVGRVELDIVDDPHHGEMLTITLLHRRHIAGEQDAPPPHVHRLPMRDVRLIHGHGGLEKNHVPPTRLRAAGEPAFHAALAAIDIARQYPYREE